MFDYGVKWRFNFVFQHFSQRYWLTCWSYCDWSIRPPCHISIFYICTDLNLSSLFCSFDQFVCYYSLLKCPNTQEVNPPILINLVFPLLFLLPLEFFISLLNFPKNICSTLFEISMNYLVNVRNRRFLCCYLPIHEPLNNAPSIQLFITSVAFLYFS